MEVESLGDLWTYGARVYVRCAHGRRDGLKTIRECVDGMEFDLRQLLWTHGKNFPIAALSQRLKCPSCGSRTVSVRFSLPTQTEAARVVARR